MANLTLRAVKGSPLTNAEMDGNFEYFTGSHAITGSLIVTGGITGSVQGIISSSYAVTASYIQNAQSASYVLNAQSASYVLNAVSASRATTSSYALTAQTLLGSIQSASYALTASNSNTASYVAGGSVDGVVALATNALSSIEVYTAKVNADGDYKVLFTDNVNLDDNSNLYKDTNSTFLYNPGLNKLTVGALSASAGITGSLLADNIIVSGSILVSGSIVPNVPVGSSTSSFNLGSPTAAWKDIYVSNGTINFLDNTGAIVQTMGTGNNQLTGYTIISGSLAQGQSVSASGLYSHAEGTGSKANGIASHAEGFNTIAGGFLSGINANHAEGIQTTASGRYSHAEGQLSYALGESSHAEGYNTFTNGTAPGSHAEGYATRTDGAYAHAEGSGSSAWSDYSHAEGIKTYTYDYTAQTSTTGQPAIGSHAEGELTITVGRASHAEGKESYASGSWSHTEGYQSFTSGQYSHAEGYTTLASGQSAHAEGLSTIASGSYSHAEGYITIARGPYSHAEGYRTTASGEYSHAEGQNAIAVSDSSHAEGYFSTAGLPAWNTNSTVNGTTQLPSSIGNVTSSLPPGTVVALGANYLIVSRSFFQASLTQVQYVSASTLSLGGGLALAILDANNPSKVYPNQTLKAGYASHAEGSSNIAVFGHAEGYGNIAFGSYSHAEGIGTIAVADGQHTSGRYNRTSSNPDDLFIIGNGDDNSNRKDILLVSTSSLVVSGSILVSGSIVPNVPVGSTTSSFNLGSPTAAWKDIYVSNGTINFLNSNGTVAQTMGTGNNQLVGNTSVNGAFSVTGSVFVKDIYPVVFGKSNNTNFSNSTFLHGKSNQVGTDATYAHVEGTNNNVDGYASHAEGVGNQIWSGATGSHAEGYGTQIYGDPFTIGEEGSYSHTEGYYTVSSGSYSHAEGYYSVTIGSASHAEGAGNYTYGPYSHAEGSSNITMGEGSHAEGQANIASGSYSHVEGAETQTTGAFSHAEGFYSIAVGDYSHAEGGGGYSLGAGGYAGGKGSHAEGILTMAMGTASHAEGQSTQANGPGSHAEGYSTVALGNFSHAEGWFTVASGSYQHVQGRYNTHGDSNSLLIVGNGTSTGARGDAFKVRPSGSIVLPTTQSAAPSWTGTNGEMIFATVSGNHFFYVWMGNQWRSGSLA